MNNVIYVDTFFLNWRFQLPRVLLDRFVCQMEFVIHRTQSAVKIVVDAQMVIRSIRLKSIAVSFFQ